MLISSWSDTTGKSEEVRGDSSGGSIPKTTQDVILSRNKKEHIQALTIIETACIFDWIAQRCS